MKKTTVKVRKPSTGTDWRMSSAGTITSSALRLLAASVATMNVKASDAKMAANIRSVVRSAYSGRLAGSSVTGATSRLANGAPISCAPCASKTRPPAIKMKMTTS
jgi:hypothetical protein